ncbi:MAG TPA: septal ring lytic transglycosylase RlpA family protein [Solirubrobacteraceae bacterium]|jgi:hypothetical protein|nr:septal ring lytic transglycosylase RlpA family protein [Solirubrobacteraceae bacterium]
MGSKRKTTGVRPLHVAAGALLLAVPSSTVALAATAAPAAPAASTIESVELGAAHLGYGKRLSVSGAAGPSAAGERVELQLDTADTHGWSNVAHDTVSRDGRFQLTVPVHRSGSIRVIADGAPSTAGAPASTPSAAADVVHTAIQPSLPRHITVGAELSVARQEHGVLGGQSTAVSGRLQPGVRGRRVELQERSGRRWSTVGSARTSARGRFKVRFRPQGGALRALRVRFAGDAVNTAVSARAGSITVYSPTVASWYEDGGNTACGFHAYYGVANVSLPCGTKVAFRSGGRTVTATVDDRGPYVGGRSYDLNQNTAGALGFGGVGTVWASVS